MTTTPVEITPTTPLSDPSHAGQHTALNGSVANLTSRVGDLEDAAPGTASQIQQARRVAHEWVLRGPVLTGSNLLLPILWNMTGRPVQYEAAKMSLYTPAVGGDLVVDIVTGLALIGGEYDPGTMTTILASPLTIPEGEFESPFYYAVSGDFVGEMAPESFIAAYVIQTGAEGTSGSDLTIQLNRLL